MVYSPLINETMPPTGIYKGGKKWSDRPKGVVINGVNVHHHAAVNNSGINRLVSSNDPASANYIIRNNGALIGSVPEEFRAWTSSTYANDDDKITVEIQNETGAPEWRVSAAAIATLIRLLIDIGKRYGFTPSRVNVKGHCELPGTSTACPGPYLLPRLDGIVASATAGNVSNPVPIKPPAPPKPTALKADGYWGSATTKRLQQVLGTPADGIVSKQTPYWRAKNPGLTTGWDWTGRTNDGGSRLIATMQHKMGITSDGKMGPDTIKALQRRFGTPIDGIISKQSRLVIALQNALNTGRF